VRFVSFSFCLVLICFVVVCVFVVVDLIEVRVCVLGLRSLEVLL
jgi:hypothetical protein